MFLFSSVLVTLTLSSSAARAQETVPEKKFAAAAVTTSPKYFAVRTIADRAAFVKRWDRIQEGMTQAQILKLVGPPDRKGRYADRLGYNVTKVGWFYGCAGPQQLPTLGTVSFDDSGIVRGVSNGIPYEFPPHLMTEAELRSALVEIDQIPSVGYLYYSPALMIRSVNHFLPMGKEKVLAVASEYWRAAAGSFRPDATQEWEATEHKAGYLNPVDGDQWIVQACEGHNYTNLEMKIFLRILFEPPDPKHPEWVPSYFNYFGPYFDSRRPVDTMICPRWPVGMGSDVPFAELLPDIDGRITSMGYNGYPYPDILYYRAHGVLRAHPLHPPDSPLEAMNAVKAAGQWLPARRYLAEIPYSPDNSYSEPRADSEEILRHQILMMLAPL